MLANGKDSLDDLLPHRLAAAWAAEKDNEDRHVISLLLALVMATDALMWASMEFSGPAKQGQSS